MARLAESNNAHTWNAKRFRFRSAIRGRRCREQLRRIDCQRQRKVLVCPSEKAILKRWHFKARSGPGGLTRRSRISKALRKTAEIISPPIARITRILRGRRCYADSDKWVQSTRGENPGFSQI